MLLLNTISAYQTTSHLGSIKNSKTNIPILAILVFAIIFGIRYNVGIDHLRYIENYETINIIQEDYKGLEVGFYMVNKFFASLSLHYSWLFTFLAFLQLFLLCYAFRYHYKIVNCLIITFILSTTFLNFMNGIRQEIAFCFQTVALYFLSRKKILKCYISIICAITFHTSAVILLPLPLLFIKRDNYFKNIKIQICLFLLFFIISVLFKPATLIFLAIIDILEVFGYQNYKYMVLGGDLSFLEPKREAGLGFILIFLMNLINIINSNKVKDFFNSKLLNIIYDFYFVGVLYYFLTSGSLMLSRVNYYFNNFNFIISAFTIYYLLSNKTKSNIMQLILFMIIYVGLFGAVVILRGDESCAIYKTCFQ